MMCRHLKREGEWNRITGCFVADTSLESLSSLAWCWYGRVSLPSIEPSELTAKSCVGDS